jgi:hypothetical protein
MLISLLILATFAISTATSWLRDGTGDSPLRADSAAITPRDPSTFVLAVIALGTLAIYWLATHRARRTGTTPRTRGLPAQATRYQGADADAEPSRDAA